MKVIDVFSSYYAAKGKFNGVARHGAVVKLTATSDAGNISYDYSVSFFPYDDPEDFRISYDAEFSKTAYSARGRRSAKREKELLAALREEIDGLAAANGGKVYWEKPLIEERRG